MFTNNRVSNVNCCVYGCGNNYSNTDSSVKFYSFPGKPHVKKRREQWIQSVHRKEYDGSPWEPTKSSRICSKHFIGNEKSNHPNHPSYLPTIFPPAYEKRQISASGVADTQKIGRFRRALRRKSVKVLELAQSVEIETVFLEQKVAVRSQNFSCQVNFNDITKVADSFIFDCTYYSNDVAVQAKIGRERSTLFKSFSDKKVGPEPMSGTELKCRGFHGHQSIKNKEQLLSRTGVSNDTFDLFLCLLGTGHGNDKLTVKDKLLLFLMKMKLGLSYCALGTFFGIYRTTVSNMFLAMLSILVDRTKSYVFWPSRHAVMETMPQAFKVNFPHCRVIIDCSELRIQQPNTVEKRVYMYSNYKGTFTAKFLVGICQNGFVSFISKCYGGRSSDAFITNDSGFLPLLEPGDFVLADKGFPGIKLDKDAIVVMPPFVHDGRLTTEEVQETYSVASVRIHVERSIQRIKMYDILHKINHDLMSSIDDIVRMCCVLANLQTPIIKQFPSDEGA